VAERWRIELRDVRLIVLGVYTFGDVSGRTNPAVTTASRPRGRSGGRFRLPGRNLGAFASAVLRDFSDNQRLGATLPAGSAWQSGVLKDLTLLLMVVILSVSTGAKEKGITAGLPLGRSLRWRRFRGPIGGASMNPARSRTGDRQRTMQHLWIYVAGRSWRCWPCRCCATRESGCAPHLKFMNETNTMAGSAAICWRP
jgi:aquaporin Z